MIEKHIGNDLVLLRKKNFPLTVFKPSSLSLFSFTDNENFQQDLITCSKLIELPETTETPKPREESFFVPFQSLVTMDKKRQKVQTSLSRLTVNISNNCNLWCSYCYADHGFYHAPKSYMSLETTRDIIDKTVSIYDPINVVHFFGGEPFMNPSVMKFTCEYFTRLYDAKLISKIPQFVATTNGTILNDEILDLLKKYDVGLTISLDGPKKIHDFLRPMVKGKSSFDELNNNMETLRNNKIKLDIEGTFTTHHIRMGISVIDLMNFFYEQYNCQVIQIAPAYTPRSDSFHLMPQQVVDQYGEAAIETVNNVVKGSGPGLAFSIGVIKSLISKQKSLACCPAFFDQMSIAVNGDVYPCFMFIGDDAFKMGNILSDNFPNNTSSQLYQRYLEEWGPNPTGHSKWYSPLSFGCVAGDYISSDVNKLGTQYFEDVYENVIVNTLLTLAKHHDKIANISIEKLEGWMGND